MSRVAAIQMNSSSRVQSNLDSAARLIEQAAGSGAGLIVLPENFALMPRRENDRRQVAERLGAGPIQEFLSGQAAASVVQSCPEARRLGAGNAYHALYGGKRLVFHSTSC